MSQSSRRPKREFRPGSHATIYLVALLYLCYLLAQLVQNFLQGGENAPELTVFIVGVVLLGCGIAALGLMAWRITHLPPRENEAAKDAGVEEAIQEETLPETEKEGPPEEKDI